MTILKPGARILFQGDSITDCGRERADPGSLGGGYVNIAAEKLRAQFPKNPLTILNRGISGDCVRDLLSRWQADALDLKPDVISILIGINHVWNRYRERPPTAVDDFEAEYRRVLELTRPSGAQLVLLEPFVLHALPDRAQWHEDLDPKIQIVRALALEFGALLIPLDGLFAAAAACNGDPAAWAADGVHPTPAGHALIAEEWLPAVISPDAA